jgi:hypothetical protein
MCGVPMCFIYPIDMTDTLSTITPTLLNIFFSSITVMMRCTRKRRRRRASASQEHQARRSSRISNQNTLTPLFPSTSASSILENARVPTIWSTGSSQGSGNTSSYVINYRTRQEEVNMDDSTRDGTRDHHVFNMNDDILLENGIYQQAMQQRFERNYRICYCDDLICPSSCTDCTKEAYIPCQKHQTVSCQNEVCTRQFYVSCIQNYANINQDTVFICIACSSLPQQEDHQTWNQIDLQQSKRRRLDFTSTSDGVSARSIENQNNKLLQMMGKVIPDNVVDALKNNDPMPYPSIVPLDDECLGKHVVYGRRFEISTLMYDIRQCDCCGKVLPGHCDPNFPKEFPFEQKHFSNTFHNAWKCECDSFCKGTQFYSHKKRSEINRYKRHHNDQTPCEFLHVDKSACNAILCKSCYMEIGTRNVEGKSN